LRYLRSWHNLDDVTIAEGKRTHRNSATILDTLRQKPGITVPELADEVKRLNIEREILETLRDAVDIAIADARPARDGLDPEDWGAAPSTAQLRAARKVKERARKAALAAVLEDALTREQAAEQLGVTPQAVSERMKAGKLTSVRRGREWRFPAWQFGEDDALAGLAQLVAAWPGTPVALSIWATKPATDLGGRTPAQEMNRRDGALRVLDLVHAISAAAW
jgi:excisionase family DNA binding protein